MDSATSDLAKLTANIASSAKYRNIAPELIQLIGSQELAKRPQLKAAIKATKNKLHQVTGAYWQGKPDYAKWLALLERTAINSAVANPELLQNVCLPLLNHHASTYERASLLPSFYTKLFAGLPPITSILDLACGLNPLTIPWMALPPDATYFACDINQEQMSFLQQALPLLNVTGEAFICDLLQEIPSHSVDVALLLKTIPCLEQVDTAIGLRLLSEIKAQTLLISFPAQSLGGHNKGMAQNYRMQFYELLDASTSHWKIEQLTFDTEIVFRLQQPH